MSAFGSLAYPSPNALLNATRTLSAVDAVRPVSARHGARGVASAYAATTGNIRSIAPATTAAPSPDRIATTSTDRVELSANARLPAVTRDSTPSRDNGTYGLDARFLRQTVERRQFGLALPGESSAPASDGKPSPTASASTGSANAPHAPHAAPASDGRPHAHDDVPGEEKESVDNAANPEDASGESGDAQTSDDPQAPRGADGKPLDDADLRQIDQLEQRDREVRTHEQAHVAAGGGYITHGARYEYQEGPDGKRYAVGGEVGIDTSAESDPEQTVRKMRTVRAAALAPAEPSGQDRAVAATASQREAEARGEIMAQQAEAREAAAQEAKEKAQALREEGGSLTRDLTGASSPLKTESLAEPPEKRSKVEAAMATLSSMASMASAG